MNKLKRIKTLRWRTLIVISTMLIGLVFAIYMAFSTIMLQSITRVERKETADHMERVRKAIQDDLAQLSLVVGDWAPWDDTYEFVENTNKEYVDGNLNDETLANLNINVMIFTNNAGQVVFSKAIDLENESEAPIPQGITEHLKKSKLLENNDSDFAVEGIVLLPDGPMMIASHPILTSNREGPVHGDLIVGRFLDAAEVSRLSERMHLAIKVRMLKNKPQTPYGLISAEEPVISRAVSNNKIAGYAMMEDIYGQPAIGIQVLTARDVYAIGQNAIRYMIYALVGVGIIFMIGMLLFLEKNVLSRIFKLSRSVKSIGDLGTFDIRLEKEGRDDELSIVSGEINNMLDKLHEAHDELELRVQERTAELAASNKALHSEIIEREKIQARIKYLAYHDHLTDLPNRSLIIERLKQAILHAKRTEKALAVMFLDLDEFKAVNDTLGHAKGDELLIEVAGRLKNTLRESDSIARIGGDEFVIVVQNLTDVNSVTRIANKILDEFRQPFKIDNQEYFNTASIGIALYPTDGNDVDTLIKNADIAMYRAKENGRNKYMLCTSLMKDKVEETMRLSNNLHRALERDELILHYQPQVNQDTGEIIGMEALLRWNHPELGLVSPTKIIPIAEQTGLITSIGDWVLRTACKQNKAWQDAGFAHVRMAVNLSMLQFQDPKMVEKVSSILKETGLDSKYLELEITESIAMKDPEYVMEILQSFKDLGITISIDDFGTEYSSLQYLKQLPFDRVKIAMPFIRGISINDKDEAIVKAIIILAKNLGLDVIGEGVETDQQLEFLARHKCEEIQGYYYYKPLLANEIEEILRNDIDIKHAS